MKQEKLCGIYLIKCNGLVYVGQSINITVRKNKHLSDLNNKKHFNYKLQNAFNTDPNIEFTILEKCEKDQLNSKEVYWLNYFDSSNILNLATGGNCYPLSQEHKNSIKLGCNHLMLPVIAYDFYSKKVLGDYKSIMEASRCFGINSNSISSSCKHKINHTHGIMFRYKEDKTPIEKKITSNYEKFKRFKAINLTTKTETIFSNQYTASKMLRLHRESISAVLRGKQKRAGNYLFKYIQHDN